ncbi:MAG: hypothetical protein ABSC47_09375 [Terracidiphilus sp.]|jgi:hypothetical protein
MLAESRVREFARNVKSRLSLWNGAAVFLGALFMAWPAFYNGFPLLYPDSMTYVDDGRIVARAVFLHQFSNYYGMRSFFYSLGILPLHWNLTLWPVVALQCLLAAFILWLVARSIAPRHTILSYLVLVLLLSLFTGMNWYAVLIMPDILGPLLYLSIYLLVFARETLSRRERISLYPIAWWAVTSHATHLLLAAGMCMILALLLAFDPRAYRRRLLPVLEVAAIVALAAAAQLALHGYLYGKPSLNGNRPPFLTARIIADGPGRWYLEKHCGELKWVICGHLHNLSDDPDNFLWGEDGIYQNASEDESRRLAQEELPFVLATLRAYPREQISRSAANFWGQLATFGFEDLDASSWVLDEFGQVLPRTRSSYEKSLQAQDALPLDLLTSIQFWAVMASLAVMAVFAPLLWRRHSPRIAGLSVVIVSMVIANALVTGPLSMVEERFECRVIWLVPLLAGMCVLDWIHQREAARSGH